MGSGLGKTSGKGHKGAKARSGGGKRPGFEGGQMPLYRRVPKQRLHQYLRVRTTRLSTSSASTCLRTARSLTARGAASNAGLIKKAQDGVKVLGNGELTKKLTVKAAKFTDSAKEKIEAVGGKAEVI